MFKIACLFLSLFLSFKVTAKDVVVSSSVPSGMGNLMFFLAGQVAYAHRFDKDFCLTNSPRPPFKLPFRRCTPEEERIANSKICSVGRFSHGFMQKSDCLKFDAYFQDERFFADHKDFIKNLFQFTEPFPEKVLDLAEEIKSRNSVSIHIRRGDYLWEKRPIMSLEYYEAGADYIQSKTKLPIRLYVFSNDVKWVKENFRSKYPFTIVEGNSAVTDMHLMTLCHHNIIANSSFSWWGAYLNSNSGKIVIAPNTWDFKHPWWGDDIILKDWIILDAKVSSEG